MRPARKWLAFSSRFEHARARTVERPAHRQRRKDGTDRRAEVSCVWTAALDLRRLRRGVARDVSRCIPVAKAARYTRASRPT